MEDGAVTVEVLPGLAFVFLLVFARLGAMAMVLPALGERGVPARLRLVFALLLTLLLMPLLGIEAAVPQSLWAMAVMILRELVIGLSIGLVVRLLMSAVQTAATTIAFQMGLGFAQGLDPTQGQQGALFASFLSVLAVMLIFATDTHHLLIKALYDSYALLPPGETMPVGDMAELALDTAATSFRIAVQISAPFLLFGLLFYLGMGVLSRLIPQIQIFFIAMPLNIMLGFALLFVLLAGMMGWFMDHFLSGIAPLLAR